MDSIKCLNKSTIKLLDKNKLLKPLIKSELRKSKISIVKFTEEEEKILIEKFIKDNGINNEKIFDQWIMENHGSRDKFKENFLNSHRIRIFCKHKYLKKAEERYLKRKNILDQVVYSLIRVQGKHLATELYLQITSREKDFGDLATKYSEGEERKSRGIVGPVSLSQATPKVREILKSAKIKDVVPPIQVDKWHVIIRLESRIESNLDELMKQRMAEEIFDELLEVEAKQKVIELLKEVEII